MFCISQKRPQKKGLTAFLQLIEQGHRILMATFLNFLLKYIQLIFRKHCTPPATSDPAIYPHTPDFISELYACQNQFVFILKTLICHCI